MTLTRKVTREAATANTAEDILEYDPKTVASGEMERRMTKIQKSRSMIKPSRNGSADPSNRPCATRTRKMRTKKKISLPL